MAAAQGGQQEQVDLIHALLPALLEAVDAFARRQGESDVQQDVSAVDDAQVQPLFAVREIENLHRRHLFRREPLAPLRRAAVNQPATADRDVHLEAVEQVASRVGQFERPAGCVALTAQFALALQIRNRQLEGDIVHQVGVGHDNQQLLVGHCADGFEGIEDEQPVLGIGDNFALHAASASFPADFFYIIVVSCCRGFRACGRDQRA